MFLVTTGEDFREVRQAVLAGTVVLALAHLIIMPRWRYRVHRWESTPEAVYTQSGWFTTERRIAPVSRIQTVDSHIGPFERLFRLANVTVTTDRRRSAQDPAGWIGRPPPPSSTTDPDHPGERGGRDVTSATTTPESPRSTCPGAGSVSACSRCTR